MALTKEHFKAFEAIVGPRNITEDPADLDAYAWRSGLVALTQEHRRRFEAILLPGSTADVQAIVRLCNRTGVQFKASSTGWGGYADPGGPGCVKLDLRRMNRILEINEDGMYAVVEPYVTSAQLQAELMKRGLYTNVNGAGGNTSALPLAAHEGIGHLSQGCSFGERNLLAVEWVAPDGEIIRTGSLGAVGEWFCGDGPGPSLRGVIRGNVTPLGGMGVYTTAATKLYHWGGPPAMELKGASPSYSVAGVPERLLMRYLSFPTEDGRTAAVRRIGEHEIGTVLMGFNVSMLAANIATSNEEELRLADEYGQDVLGPGFVLGVVGNSERDFAYKKNVLDLVLEETGGSSLKAVEDPEVQYALLWRCVRVTSSIRETMRGTGAFAGEVFGTDSYGVQANFIQHSIKDKQDLIDRGLIYDDSTLPFLTSIEHGHFGHSEVLLRYTPGPAMPDALMGYVMKSNVHAVNGHYGMPHHVFGDELHSFFGPSMSDYPKWLRKVKTSFDPKHAAEASTFISPAKEEAS